MSKCLQLLNTLNVLRLFQIASVAYAGTCSLQEPKMDYTVFPGRTENLTFSCAHSCNKTYENIEWMLNGTQIDTFLKSESVYFIRPLKPCSNENVHWNTYGMSIILSGEGNQFKHLLPAKIHCEFTFRHDSVPCMTANATIKYHPSPYTSTDSTSTSTQLSVQNNLNIATIGGIAIGVSLLLALLLATVIVALHVHVVRKVTTRKRDLNEEQTVL